MLHYSGSLSLFATPCSNPDAQCSWTALDAWHVQIYLNGALHYRRATILSTDDPLYKHCGKGNLWTFRTYRVASWFYQSLSQLLLDGILDRAERQKCEPFTRLQFWRPNPYLQACKLASQDIKHFLLASFRSLCDLFFLGFPSRSACWRFAP